MKGNIFSVCFEIYLLLLTDAQVDSRTSGRSSRPNICIVQYDNRPSVLMARDGEKPWLWLPYGANEHRLPYWTMSYVVNYAYALGHGYGYLLIQGTGPCTHPKAGVVKHTWCKVKAMKLAQEARPFVDYFIYLDSDSYFPNHSTPFAVFVERILRRYANAKDATLIVSSEPFTDCIDKNRNPRPLRDEECRANSGVQFWRSSPFSSSSSSSSGSNSRNHGEIMKSILNDWWNQLEINGNSSSSTSTSTSVLTTSPVINTDSSISSFSPAHFRLNWGFEQSVLSKWIVDSYPDDIAIIPINSSSSSSNSVDNDITIHSISISDGSGRNDDSLHGRNDKRPLFNSPNGSYIAHYWGSPTGWPNRVPKFTERMKWLLETGFWNVTLNKRCNHMLHPYSTECIIARRPWATLSSSSSSRGAGAGSDMEMVVRTIKYIMPLIPVLLQEVEGGPFREFTYPESLFS